MFWSDNWLGKVLHGPLPCDENLTIQEAFCELENFLPLIEHQLHDKIQDKQNTHDRYSKSIRGHLYQ